MLCTKAFVFGATLSTAQAPITMAKVEVVSPGTLISPLTCIRDPSLNVDGHKHADGEVCEYTKKKVNLEMSDSSIDAEMVHVKMGRDGPCVSGA